MNCAISQDATVKMNEILVNEEDPKLKFRVFVGHAHGDHAHYGLGLDYQKDTDELVKTPAGVEILLEQGQAFLSDIEIDYDPESDAWSIVNPKMKSHHE